jgi:hypothetical protein
LSVPEFHSEPYLHLAGLSHKSALVTDHMEALLPLFAQGAARVVFSGQEHNFQHSHHAGIDYFATGAGGKVRKGRPDAGRHPAAGIVLTRQEWPDPV